MRFTPLRAGRRGGIFRIARGSLMLAFAFAGALGASAQSLEKTDAALDAKLERSLRELSEVRERIAREKLPLSRSVLQLEQEVLELRRKRDRLLEVRDSRTIDLSSLRKQVESLGEQEQFVESRLDEFVRDFEARLNISELPRFEALTSAARLAEKNANLEDDGKRRAQIAVVDAALGRLRDQLGGMVFPGEALSPEGVLTQGSFVALGPTVFYATEDGRVSGLVEHQLNAADPVVVPLPGSLGDGIARIAASGQGLLPLDPTLGKALKVEKARKSLGQYVEEGGAVGLVIIALGLSALGLTAFKTLEILRFPVAGPESVDAVLSELSKGNLEAAAWQAKRAPGVSGRLLSTGVENAHEKRGVLEELLFERILEVRPLLERFLPFLAITAAAAPLLGLLGTVTGMIRTFQLITIFGTGDAKSLSSGISEALVTTALGLVVAIPTLILHGALSRMARRKLGLLEQLSVSFTNGVAAIRRRAEPHDE
jgi:biopolymer transport protein ExbB